MNPVRIGVIGAGNISNFHAKAYQNCPGARLAAVCDTNPERAKAFAAAYGVPQVFASHRELLERGGVDAVSVTTWNNGHAPISIDALNAGKHVLCEKPLALNAAEAQAMADAAKRSGKLLMVGFVRRFAENTKALKAAIDAGDLGEIYSAKVSLIRRWGNPGGWFSDKARSGGGALIDLGVHIIDLARYLGGNPRPVSAYAAAFRHLGMKPDILGVDKYYSADYSEFCDVEDSATAMVRFDNGMVAYVEVSWVENAENSAEIRFCGTRAGANLEPTLAIHEDRHHYLCEVRPQIRYQGIDMDDIFRGEIGHFVDCIQNGTPCICPAEDGLEIMKILDAIYESARTGHEAVIR